MKNLTVRVLLVLVAIGSLGAAGYQAWRLEQDKRTAEQARGQVDDRFRAALFLVADLRAQQQAYVAAGQGSAFWAARVAQSLSRFDDALADLKALPASPDAQTALDEAANAIDTFRKMDVRAREFARGGQNLLASDLIFSDGFETTAAALTHLESARVAEAVQAETGGRAIVKTQLQVLGAGAAVCVLVIVALTPRGRARPPAATPAATHPRDEETQPAVVAAAAPAAASRVAEYAHTEPPDPDLAAAAEVCAGLARVLESAELNVLLGRAAQVIDAAGLIVWVADRSGAELRPALAHGYSNQTLSRMGTIARDAHNAVAAAYRTGTVRTVAGDAVTNGAVVAPIVSPGGCVGALAAEVRHGGEHHVAIKALAMVFASQLGTLVSSVPADAGVSHAQA